MPIAAGIEKILTHFNKVLINPTKNAIIIIGKNTIKIILNLTLFEFNNNLIEFCNMYAIS